jgi:hypothetical protein
MPHRIAVSEFSTHLARVRHLEIGAAWAINRDESSTYNNDKADKAKIKTG